jgi:hypothetical protein
MGVQRSLMIGRADAPLGNQESARAASDAEFVSLTRIAQLARKCALPAIGVAIGRFLSHVFRLAQRLYLRGSLKSSRPVSEVAR